MRHLFVACAVFLATAATTQQSAHAAQEATFVGDAGIGVIIEAVEDGGILIKEVLANSPAAIAGLLAGDYIHAIDGVATKSMTVAAATELIRGKDGTEVEITIRRGNAESHVKIIRQSVQSTD
ncbi:S41 family peptidase [Novosphingobium sp.]|uniref:S41 family peptidase n=1 Tax=Novosphingobium sp. TaxID=1874826 RepID=UPI003D0A34DC